MPSGRRPGHTPPVLFDAVLWAEDMIRASNQAREAAASARLAFEANGIPLADLRPCASEGSHGTSLPHAVKVYLPPPIEPHGMVLDIDRRDGHLVLSYLAFGLRHPARDVRQPSVYEVAHRRLYEQQGA